MCSVRRGPAALSSVSAAVKPEPMTSSGREETAEGEVGPGMRDRDEGGGSGCVKMPVARTRCVAWRGRSGCASVCSVSVKPLPEEARVTRVTVVEVWSVDSMPAAEGYAAKYEAA